MPVRYVVINEGRLVIERWTGQVSHAEFVAHEREKLQDTSIVAGAKALTDARAAEFPETTAESVHEITDLYGDPDNPTGISTYAGVFGGKDFGMAKAWEAQSRRQGVNTIVFNNLEVACIWLGIDPAEAQRQLDDLEF